MEASTFEKTDHILKLLLVGDSAVGKSCLVLSFTNQPFQPTNAPTIGVNYDTKFFTTNDERIKMAIWDTAGQERFRALTSGYYRDAHGVLFVYDVTRRNTFEDLSSIWMKEVDMNSTVKDAVKIIVGNKVDLVADREVSTAEGQSFADKFGCLFVETSAKNATSVALAFEELLKKIKDTPELMLLTKNEAKLKLSKSRKDSQRSFCC